MEHYWMSKDIKFVEPNIRTDEIDLVYLRITPLHMKNGKLHVIEMPIKEGKDPIRNMSYIWDPIFGSEVSFEPLYEIDTVHSCGYYGVFKPSVAEVLSAVLNRHDILNDPRVNGFRLSDEPIGIYSCGSGHKAKVLFGHYKEII